MHRNANSSQVALAYMESVGWSDGTDEVALASAVCVFGPRGRVDERDVLRVGR